MDCKYRIRIKIDLDEEYQEIIGRVFLADAEREGWEIHRDENTLVIEIPELKSEAQARGIINSILRQLEVLYKALSEL